MTIFNPFIGSFLWFLWFNITLYFPLTLIGVVKKLCFFDYSHMTSLQWATSTCQCATSPTLTASCSLFMGLEIYHGAPSSEHYVSALPSNCVIYGEHLSECNSSEPTFFSFNAGFDRFRFQSSINGSLCRHPHLDAIDWKAINACTIFDVKTLRLLL